MSSKAQIARQLLIFATQLVSEVEEESEGAHIANSPAHAPADALEEGINVAKAAKLIGISEDQIYRLVDADKIPFYRIPATRGKGVSRGDIRFVPSELVAWRKQ